MAKSPRNQTRRQRPVSVTFKALGEETATET